VQPRPADGVCGPLEEISDKRVIFATIVSKGNGRDEAEIKEAWERTLSGAVTPGIESLEKVTVVSAVPAKTNEQRQPDRIGPSKISFTVREEDRPPPKFYYSLDEKQWWEIPGEMTRVWQLRFLPKDIGVREGVIKVRGEFGDQRVERTIRIRSTQQHVLELSEP